MSTPVVNYVLSPFEGKINPGYLQGLKLYLQATNQKDKESGKLDLSFLNDKDIIYQFLSIANNYGWGRLTFVVETSSGPMNIFKQVQKIQYTLY